MTAQDLKNAEDLIRSYNANYDSNPKFKALFDYYLQRPNLAAFRGRSLRDYVKIISSFSIASIYKSYSQRKPTPDNIKDLLGKFYRSQEFIRLQQASSAKQAAEVEEADVAVPKKEAQKTREVTIPKATTPSFLKDLSSKAQIITRSAVDKTVSGLKSFSWGKNFSSSLTGQASQLGGRALNTGARMAGRAGLSALNGLNRAGMGLIRGLAISGPWGWVILGVILILFVLFPIILMLFKTNSLFGPPDGSIVSTGPGGPGSVSSKLEISKTTPSNKVDNPDPNDPNKGVINYTIKTTYKYVGVATVEVSDRIPDNTELIEASDNPTKAASLVKWLINDISTNQSKEFNLKLRATKPDTIVENTAQAKIISVITPTPSPTNTPTPGGIAGGDETPNDNDCGGRYLSYLRNNAQTKFRYGKNFGDPSCSFNKDDLYLELKRLDSPQADFWFNIVVRCESSYIPVNLNPDSTSGKGAWGLFQMNPSVNGPGMPGRGPDGLLYDRGDVPWLKQISNAVNHKNYLESINYAFRGPGSYWHVARPGKAC